MHRNGATALIKAANRGDEGVVRLLLACGARAEVQNHKGKGCRQIQGCTGPPRWFFYIESEKPNLYTSLSPRIPRNSPIQFP